MLDRMAARMAAHEAIYEEQKRKAPSPAVLLAAEMVLRNVPAPPQFMDMSQPKEKESDQ